MKEIDTTLHEIHRQKAMREKLVIHIAGVELKLRHRQKEKMLLAKIIAKSEDQFSVPQKPSLWDLFRGILGNDQQQLERERQNYLMNHLKLTALEERIAAKTFELKVLNEKRLTMVDVEERYEELWRKKRSLLKFHDQSINEKIISLEYAIRNEQHKQKEMDEALESSKAAAREVDQLKVALMKIKNWRLGYMHEFLNYKEKMFISDLMTEIKSVHSALDDFTDELNDVATHYQLDYEQVIDRVVTFLENFYDGLISDWVLHKKITISINLVDETIDKVKRLKGMLDKDREDSEEAQALIQKKIEQLVLESNLKK